MVRRRSSTAPDKLDAAKNTLHPRRSPRPLIATVLGTLLGYGLSRYRFPGKKLFSFLMYIPVVIPDIVMAVAMLMFYALVRDALGLFQLGMTTMVLSHVTFQIPFVAIVVRSRLVGMDPAIEEAAHDLGATSLQTFRHVTLPLILPAVVAGAHARLHPVARRLRGQLLHHRPGRDDAADPDLLVGQTRHHAGHQRPVDA